jgi:hypothetical protein
VLAYVGVSPEGFEKGAAVELARRGAWSVNGVLTNRSAGANIARDIIRTRWIDAEAAVGAGWYYQSEKVLPSAGFNLRF